MSFTKTSISKISLLTVFVVMVACITTLAADGPLAAADATPNSVTLNWTAPGDDGSSGIASQYDIRYSTSLITDANWDAATQIAGEPAPQTAGSAESFEVTGLEPSTTYYFAIKAADEVPNWSAMSNVISKSTTDESIPPSDIASLAIGTITQNSIGLSWTAPGDDGTVGIASVYDIRYSTSLISDANWDAATQVTGEPSPQSAGSGEYFTVNSLDAGTTYYFAIKTADEVPNWSGLSNIVSASTSAAPTPPDPPILASPADGAVNQTQPVTLDWGTVSGADNYQLQLADNVSINSPIKDTVTAIDYYSASGMDDNTTYYWRVRAHNENGWGDWSDIRNFATECPIAPAPVLASPSNGATDVANPVTLSWNAVTDATRYHLQVDNNSDFSSPLISASAFSASYEATTLSDNQTYYWRVRTESACGWSDFSDTFSFTTSDATAPSMVTTLNAAIGENHGEVVLIWTSVGDDATVGTADSYDIRYSLDSITDANWSSATRATGEPSPQEAGNLEQFTVSGLDASLVYYFAIKVQDDAGNESPLSNVVSANPADKTPPAMIEDLTAESGLNDGEIQIGWTAPGDDGDEGMVSAYLIKYSQEYLDETNWESAAIYEEYVLPLPAGQLQSKMLSGLDPGQEYYIGVQCFDECANGSPISNIAMAEAGISIILDVDDETTEPVSPGNGTQLHSSMPLLAVHNITAPGENFYYFEVATDSFYIDVVAVSPPVPQGGGDITQWRVDTKLDADQTYYWRAKANNYEYTSTSYFAVNPEAHVYPNPFRPDNDVDVTFSEVPDGANVILMSVSGSTVREWSNVSADNLRWDGTNESGERVSSGTYLWFVEGTDQKGKIVVMR